MPSSGVLVEAGQQDNLSAKVSCNSTKSCRIDSCNKSIATGQISPTFEKPGITLPKQLGPTHSHPNPSSFNTQIQIHIPHVTLSPKVVRELKIDHTNAIYPPCMEPEARNSAVGWHWNTHTHVHNFVKVLKMVLSNISL